MQNIQPLPCAIRRHIGFHHIVDQQRHRFGLLARQSLPNVQRLIVPILLGVPLTFEQQRAYRFRTLTQSRVDFALRLQPVLRTQRSQGQFTMKMRQCRGLLTCGLRRFIDRLRHIYRLMPLLLRLINVQQLHARLVLTLRAD